ncbi:MAG: response regulator [Bacteroidetes bacterium]|nr:response regulator [Bacteroidota bacterium]
MKKEILTIEDCSAISYVISSVLKKDYTVTSVGNSVEAFAQMQTASDKDLIILNIPDSNSDNMKLLKHMSSSEVFNKIPTVVISNSDDPSLKDQTVELGASLFLTKPFDPVYLSDKVKDLIYENGSVPPKKRKTLFHLNIF